MRRTRNPVDSSESRGFKSLPLRQMTVSDSPKHSQKPASCKAWRVFYCFKHSQVVSSNTVTLGAIYNDIEAFRRLDTVTCTPAFIRCRQSSNQSAIISISDDNFGLSRWLYNFPSSASRRISALSRASAYISLTIHANSRLSPTMTSPGSYMPRFCRINPGRCRPLSR
jgi:hypothetical protein